MTPSLLTSFRSDLNCLRNRIRFSLDKWLLATFNKTRAVHVSTKKRVGILRLDGLGDLILFLDALKGFRTFFDESKYEICLIVEEWLADLVKRCPDIDDRIAIHTRKFRKNPLYRYKKLCEIHSAGFEIFIDASILRSLSYGDIMTYSSGATFRYGFEAQPNQKCEQKLGDLFYTHLVPDPKWQVHELERNGELVRAVGYTNFHIARPRLERFSNDEKDSYFVVAPSSRFAGRRWPLPNFIHLSRMLFRHFKYLPMIIGGKEDQFLVPKMIELAPDLPWIDRVGKLDMSGLSDVLARGQFIVCNDSGPMHLSMALNLKTIAIVPGAEYRVYPEYPPHLRENVLIIHDVKTDCFNCRWDCIYNKNQNEIKPCLENITVERVYQKTIEFFTQGISCEFK